ncbi:hypothetical protein JB92DRAFT_2826283 [Gautieria morchelliformis]|nr:hypothetical protein JB92DRAFT_2826283 [Gautieria morchelliformis]
MLLCLGLPTGKKGPSRSGITPESLAASPVNKLDKGYKPHAPGSGSATIISTTTPNAIENPLMIPDSLFDAWLKLKLDTAVDQQPARHKCLTVPAMLFNMVDSIHFLGGRDTMKWAQWLMDTAFAVPPAHLVSSIEEKASIKRPLAEVLASNALEAIAHDL